MCSSDLAFEIALEAAALGVVFTWGTIFLCQLRLRMLSNRGVVPPSPFQMPGHPWTSIVGLVFLALIIVGLAVTGWQSSPHFWEKTTFLVVVLGIPLLAIALAAGWLVVRPKVIENTGGRTKAVWSKDGPTYPPPERSDEELYGEQSALYVTPPRRRRSSGSTASGAGRTRR